MPYQPQPADTGFLLFEVLDATTRLQPLAPLTQADRPLMLQVLDEAGKFVGEVIAPLSTVGDTVGCKWVDGAVVTPPGFRAAYQAFVAAGWPALACAETDGGQGLPGVLEAVLYEWLSAANHGWAMAPGLLHGAYECLRQHGGEALKLSYLPRLATGEWLATMCLTEPQAGSDLGLVRTQAVAIDGAGRHAVTGTKIFISGGEHDLTDNIVHLVLARLPGAPAGPKGLSLFLVPKVLQDGARNAVVCERIEEKMGLHGSPTCVMRFDAATGWLIGQPGAGLKAMFVMMNAARLHVALQGVGLLDAAWQKADAYARERRQMRAPVQPASRGPTDAADLICERPAMRRILDTQRAWIDGGRLLAYHTALLLDVARHHAAPAERAAAERWCSLVTPVLKAALTQQAFTGASDCLQVFGGHGYVREWGIEQIVRDARVTLLYEGTNEIQAIDLLVRKVLPDGGQAMGQLLLSLRGTLDAGVDTDAEALRRLAELRFMTTSIAAAAAHDAALAHEVADDYLRAVALVLMCWAWCRITASSSDPRWTRPAQAFRHWVLPELDMRLQIVRARLKAAAPSP